jgi:phytoene dehydrogenase-like protein
VRTEELTVPGFLHDVYSSSHPLFVTSQAYAELGPELAQRGLRYLNTDLPTGVSMPDGRTAVFARDAAANVAEADRLAPGDGAAFQAMMEEFGAQAGNIFPLFGLDLTSPAAQPFLRALTVRPDGHGPSTYAADLVRTAREVLERFRSPVFQAMAAPWVLHLGRTPDGAGSGPWIPLTLAALMGGGMATAEGGSEQLARALVRLIEDHGGVIQTGVDVEKIVVENGRAVAVRVGHHEFRAERAVIASTNPDQLYLRLLADTNDADIPPPLRKEAAAYRYGRGCVQIHLALSEPPRWADERLSKVGLIHLTPGLDALSLQVAGSINGLLPA